MQAPGGSKEDASEGFKYGGWSAPYTDANGSEFFKYVLSNALKKSDWKNTTFLKSLEDIKKLKDSEGSDLHVWGSSKLIQLLLKNDLVDELRLVTYSLTLGQGKKLFAEGTIPAAFELTESSVTPSGVIMVNYKRAGKVVTGTVGA